MNMNKIKYYRIKNDLTQAELANKVGVTRQYLSDVEIGKYSLSDKIALKVAAVFDVSVDELRGEKKI